LPQQSHLTRTANFKCESEAASAFLQLATKQHSAVNDGTEFPLAARNRPSSIRITNQYVSILSYAAA
jgi:hypothetical protein